MYKKNTSRSFQLLPIILLGLLYFLTACRAAPALESPAPPATTVPPAASPALAASPSARPTDTPVPELTLTTPEPSSTSETRWSEAVRLSQGVILCAPRFSPDGTRFAIPTSNGISIYETNGWAKVVELGNGMRDWGAPCALAYSPDGKWLATSYGTQIRLWQETGADPPKTLNLEEEAYIYNSGLDFSPDGSLLAAGYWRGLETFTTVFTTSDWQPIYTVQGHQPHFSPDGRRLATVTQGNEGNPFVYLYTADQGQVIHYWEGESVAFLPDDELLIELNGSVRVMETQDQAFAARLAFTGNTPALSPDGHTVAVYQDGFVRVVDLADGALVRSLALPTADPLWEAESLLFSPDGQRITAGFSTLPCDSCQPLPGPIFVWENRAEAPGYELPTPPSKAWLSFEPAGKALIVAANQGISRYDPSSGALIGSLTTFSDYISELAVSRDGNLLAVGYSETGYFGLRIWDFSTLSEPRQYPSIPQEGLSGDWWKMAFSPDGDLVGMGGYFWQAETGELLPGWPPLTAPDAAGAQAAHAISLAFAPDGDTVALGYPEGVVQLWNLDTITSAQTLTTDYPGDVVSLAYSPDGAQLAAALAYTLDAYPSPFAQAWQMPAGLPQYRLLKNNITFLAFSPNGQQLATISAPYETYQRNFAFGTVQLWSNGGELQATLPPDKVVRLAFSPDGRTMALGLADGQVQLWSQDGKLIQALDTSQAGVISGLAFTPDGQRLVIASGTGVIEIWSR